MLGSAELTPMYSTCIFCNAPLGANEVLERFPVGRRLAYDESTGRLWVVCRACERWNLSPLETRWEAIEDAERVFRATPLKATGENIAMAQTTEGLELVRIGRPPKVELLAWRYGDQFGRRRRRHLVIGSGIVAASAGVGALSFATGTGPLFWTVFSAVTGALNIGNMAFIMKRLRGPKRLLVQGPVGKTLVLNADDTRAAALVPAGEEWKLEIRHRVQRGASGGGVLVSGREILAGNDALRALSRLLPYLNREGGSKRNVRDAVNTIDRAASLDQLLRAASTNDEARKTHYKVPKGKSNVSILPARIRLAMEMALHEDDERRAMEGELAALEARWREADAIARIADSLFIPDEVDRELARLRAGGDRS